MAQVYWTVLADRNVGGDAVSHLLMVASECGAQGFKLIVQPWGRTDIRRQSAVDAFMKDTSDPNDCLVMLDNDHPMPANVVTRLTSHPPELGVVGALTYGRGERCHPLFFIHGDGLGKDQYYLPLEISGDGPEQVDIVATCAIAIRRWVLEKLTAGEGWKPLFQYEYSEDGRPNTEDVYFGQLCERYQIPQYVDLGCEFGHYNVGIIGPQQWEAYLKAHPEEYRDIQEA